MVDKNGKNKHDFIKAPLTPNGAKKVDNDDKNDKIKDLEKNKVDNKNKAFTTNKGLKNG